MLAAFFISMLMPVVHSEGTTNAICSVQSVNSWAFNRASQSPCLIGAQLIAGCVPGGDHHVEALRPSQGKYYNVTQTLNIPPHPKYLPCECNTVVYSLMAACGLCQGGYYSDWIDWSFGCDHPTDHKNQGYPFRLPANVSIPAWAYNDIMNSWTFSPPEGSAGTFPEIKAGTPNTASGGIPAAFPAVSSTQMADALSCSLGPTGVTTVAILSAVVVMIGGIRLHLYRLHRNKNKEETARKNESKSGDSDRDFPADTDSSLCESSHAPPSSVHSQTDDSPSVHIQRLSFLTVLPYVVTLAAFIALPLAMVIYLLVNQIDRNMVVEQDRSMMLHSIVVDETTLNRRFQNLVQWTGAESVIFGLLLASLVSTISVLTVQPLMRTFAYCHAENWLEKSIEHYQAGTSSLLLTTAQFGMFLQLLQTFDFGSVYHLGKLWVQTRNKGKARYFLAILGFSLVVKSLVFCIILADVWLHVSSVIISYRALESMDNLTSLNYGVHINRSVCPWPAHCLTEQLLEQDKGTNDFWSPFRARFSIGSNCISCFWQGTRVHPFGKDLPTLEAGLTVLHDKSDRWKVLMLGDVAVIVNSELSNEVNHHVTLETFGLSASCRIPGYRKLPCQANRLDAHCGGIVTSFEEPVFVDSRSNSSKSFLYDPSTMNSRIDWTYGTGHPFGIFVKLVLRPLDLSTNGVGAPVIWNPDKGGNWESVTEHNSEQANYQFVKLPFGLTGPFTFKGSKAVYVETLTFLSACNISVLRITMDHFNGTYNLLDSALADFETTSTLSGGFAYFASESHILPYLSSALYQEQTDREGFARGFRRQLLMKALGVSAGILEPKPVLKATQTVERLASKYPLGPFIALFSLLLTYTIVWIATITRACLCKGAVLTVRDKKGKPKQIQLLELAQLRLTNPLFTFADMLPLGAHPIQETSEKMRTLTVKASERLGGIEGERCVTVAMEGGSFGIRVVESQESHPLT